MQKLPKTMVIKNIRQGKGARAVYIYGELWSSNDPQYGQLLIAATLDFIQMRIKEYGVEQ